MRYLTLLVVLLMPLSALAAQNQYGQDDSSTSGSGSGNGSSAVTTTATTASQTQNRANVQTNNPDNGTAIQERARIQSPTASGTPDLTRTQTRLQIKEQIQTVAMTMSDLAGNMSDFALRQNVQTVAGQVTVDSDTIDTSLQTAESRSSFAKFFIGPNYKQINAAEKLAQQDRAQIQELESYLNTLSNEGDQTTLLEQIQVLNTQYDELTSRITELRKGFSLFGWLNRLLNNN